MEYINKSENDRSNDLSRCNIKNLKPPILIREINEYKWLFGKEEYESNYLNKSNINNNYIDNGIFFYLIEKEENMNLNITFYYLIKINDYFFQIIFKYVSNNKLPKIKYITKEEFDNTNDDVLIEKMEIFDFINNICHYFIVSYHEHGQKCYIKINT
jgi:hypothetical protein